MSSVNKVFLLGNLTRDPEVKYTPKGTAIADFGMALNRYYTTESGEKRDEVTFVDVTLWGRPAEIAGEYLKKGQQVHIEGHLKLDQWDDKQSGQKRSKLKVVGDQLCLIGGKRDGQTVRNDEADANAERGRPASRPASQERRPPPPQKRPPADPDLDAPEDDIPF